MCIIARHKMMCHRKMTHHTIKKDSCFCPLWSKIFTNACSSKLIDIPVHFIFCLRLWTLYLLSRYIQIQLKVDVHCSCWSVKKNHRIRNRCILLQTRGISASTELYSTQGTRQACQNRNMPCPWKWSLQFKAFSCCHGTEEGNCFAKYFKR